MGIRVLLVRLRAIALKNTNNYLILSWTEESSASSVKITAPRQKRFPILVAVKIAVGVSTLFNFCSSSMTSKEISDINAKQSVDFNYMQTLTNEILNNHDDIVNIAISV